MLFVGVSVTVAGKNDTGVQGIRAVAPAYSILAVLAWCVLAPVVSFLVCGLPNSRLIFASLLQRRRLSEGPQPQPFSSCASGPPVPPQRCT